VKLDKGSGFVNGAYDWIVETMHYPLEALLRVIRVSVATMKIFRALPSLEIKEES